MLLMLALVAGLYAEASLVWELDSFGSPDDGSAGQERGFEISMLRYRALATLPSSTVLWRNVSLVSCPPGFLVHAVSQRKTRFFSLRFCKTIRRDARSRMPRTWNRTGYETILLHLYVTTLPFSLVPFCILYVSWAICVAPGFSWSALP